MKLQLKVLGKSRLEIHVCGQNLREKMLIGFQCLRVQRTDQQSTLAQRMQPFWVLWNMGLVSHQSPPTALPLCTPSRLFHSAEHLGFVSNSPCSARAWKSKAILLCQKIYQGELSPVHHCPEWVLFFTDFHWVLGSLCIVFHFYQMLIEK